MEPQKTPSIDDSLFDIFKDTEFGDLLSILESLQDSKDFAPINDSAVIINPTSKENEQIESRKVSISSSVPQDSETELESKTKKLSPTLAEEPQKVSHITVERNRRKQMNYNLSVLRSLLPSFYAKRPGSPYKPSYLSPTIPNSPTSSASSSINDNIKELVANSKSVIADVEIGIECQLSAEELAQQIQQTFY
ncbi:Transcription factor SPEECHLESS Basic helix-loop-helix protein [Vigna angularis]|uniref:Transcription factor SPEECHLESS Basic helix-loop-helix protein n=1 Tax=Phaseolus angularis TaxID=3914 RepID=A0A8T0K0Y1_PHAAN|nr:Transcription factor SPEECHLESS Basic helix-loop-helix protein [Vigna angularis]